uniref:Sin3 C-terminal domain-containing protein n=1 Tax=Guillardia theta TaxID=55529 RepID=A0A7S4UTN2_GUITH
MSAQESVYDKFMRMLVQLVEGSIDTSKFEDDCRMLLGTNSYELYTLEKVVEKLLGQVQALTSEISTQSGSRHLALHEYERVRAGMEASEAELDEKSSTEYFSNASYLTGEDGCFGFFFDTKRDVLTLALLEMKHSGKCDHKCEKRKEDWFDDFVAIGSVIEDREKVPYLIRNLEKKSSDEASKRILVEELEQYAGLEMRYGEDKVTFCAHTWDYQHRPKRFRCPANFNTSMRSEKVRMWQEERLKRIPMEVEEEEARKKLEVKEAENSPDSEEEAGTDAEMTNTDVANDAEDEQNDNEQEDDGGFDHLVEEAGRYSKELSENDLQPDENSQDQAERSEQAEPEAQAEEGPEEGQEQGGEPEQQQQQEEQEEQETRPRRSSKRGERTSRREKGKVVEQTSPAEPESKGEAESSGDAKGKTSKTEEEKGESEEGERKAGAEKDSSSRQGRRSSRSRR